MPDSHHILIGRVAGVHGIRGGLKLASYAESLEEAFAAGRRLTAVAADRSETPLEVVEARPQGRSAVLFVRGVADRSGAEALVGCDLFIHRADLPPLPEGSWYWADLVGIEVYDLNGRHLGAVRSIFATGGHDVYVVAVGERELLLPAVGSVVRRVDPGARRMDVAVPEGLEPE